MSNKRVHKLENSIIVYSNSENSSLGILPKGALLYYENSLPEGIDRFVIYLNIEKSNLHLEELNPSNLIDPLTSFYEQGNQTPNDLKELLKSNDVSKSDLQYIIENWDD